MLDLWYLKALFWSLKINGTVYFNVLDQVNLTRYLQIFLNFVSFSCSALFFSSYFLKKYCSTPPLFVWKGWVKSVTCYENVIYITLTNTFERSNQQLNISKSFYIIRFNLIILWQSPVTSPLSCLCSKLFIEFT